MTVLSLSLFKVFSTWQRHSVARSRARSCGGSELKQLRRRDGHSRGRPGGHCHLLRPHPNCWHLGRMEEQGFWEGWEFGPEREHHGRRERHRTVCGRVYDDWWVRSTCGSLSWFWVCQSLHLTRGQIALLRVWLCINALPMSYKYDFYISQLFYFSTLLISLFFQQKKEVCYFLWKLLLSPFVCLFWSHLGWRRLHKWHSRVRLPARLRLGLGSGTLWLRP